MDTETERIYDRIGLGFLMKAHPDWSIRQYAAELNKSLRWVRTWRRRILSTANPTIETFMSQSRAPKTRSRETPIAVQKLISGLRISLSEKYHRRAGSRLILRQLNKRREELEQAGHFVPRSKTTIDQILDLWGHIDRPKRYEREPLERPAPMTVWEIDFGQIRLNEFEILEFFVVVDAGTSRVVYVEGCDGYHAESALEAVARLFTLHGLPQSLRMDRDVRFVGSWTGDSFPSALVRFLRVLGVKPIICPPRQPWKKPYVERTIKTLKYEWLARFSPDNIADALDVLDGFQHYHNSERDHFGSACNGLTPDEAFPDLPILPKLPQTVNPDAWIHAYHGKVYRRRVTSNGSVQIDKHNYHIDIHRHKQRVLVHLDADNQQFVFSHDGEIILTKPIQGLQNGEMSFQDYLKLMKDEARSIEQHRRWMWMWSKNTLD
jgi:transposase InsO family protein